jgi:hypothetical protein
MSATNSGMYTIRVTFRAVLLPLFLAGAAPAATDALYKSLRESPLADSLVVENIVIKRDSGVLTLKSGAIALTAPALGRDTVAVFSGEGEFTFTPQSPVDRNYMRSLTGQDTVSETFDRALFCFSDDTGKEIRASAKTPAADPKLAEILHDYRKRLRSRTESPRSLLEYMLTAEAMDNIEADLATDLYNPRAPGFFSAYLHGRKHSDLRFHVRPRGAFPAMSTPEEVAVINLDPQGAQEGVWYLSHLDRELNTHTASSDENQRTVQADSYKIETTIARNDHFTATTGLQFHAVTEGDRVIKLSLLPTLRVARVTTGGQEIPFIQEDKKEDPAFYVVMPEAMAKGSAHEVLIEYAGDKVVHKEGGGNFSVGARESWYPNVNTFRDHARYDLTFKVPKQYTLVSVGNPAKQWTEKDAACSQWVSETPIAIAGFNYGIFKNKKLTDAQSGFVTDGYATTEPPDALAQFAGEPGTGVMAPSNMMDRPMAEAQVAERIFGAWFGKSEFSRIAITQQPEFNFGQSWPNLVYLPLFAYLDPTQRYMLLKGIEPGLTDFVNEVTPHEVSHQWWGHTVGWSTYHDQWLSEGFATFSAGLYLQLTEKTPEKYLKYWQNARQRLLEKNNYGRRANEAGPLWLGGRLDSLKNDEAYTAVVYGKGGYVLHMLRQMMFDTKDGDKPFIDMMHDFVSQHTNQNASTESFQRVVEKHMSPSLNVGGNGKMDWFFSQWVYGTAIPRYKFDYSVSDADGGKFLLKATLTQSEVPADFVMAVPIYVDFDGQVVRLGSINMKGNSTSNEIKLTLPKKPRRVMANYWHDVLEAL